MLTQLPISRFAGLGFPAIPDGHGAMQLALQYQLESSQWWCPEKLLDLQLRQLRPLLAHAVATVPYYRDLFAERGIRIPAELAVEDFNRLPISSRSAVQAAGPGLESSALPAGHGKPVFAKTSGSTGRPLRFARTAVTRTLWLAFALREHLWHARDLATKLGAIRWFKRGMAEPPQGASAPDWGPIFSPTFSTGPFSALNVISTLPEQLAWLQRERPDYLISFPSNLTALARHVRDRNIELPPLREVRTIGESLPDASRRLIADTWRAKVSDIYTCEEAGYLAVQCPVSDAYHVQSENVLLEIVDADGRACLPGQVGQVLITSLNNYATPLIRYEIGDLAEFGPPCACGRGLPVIRRIHGRMRSRLVMPDGQNVFPYLGDHGDIDQAIGVKLHQFQCIQHSIEEIELKLVMERQLTATEISAIEALMQKHLGHPFRIRCSFYDEIPRGPNGKFEEFISLVNQSAAA